MRTQTLVPKPTASVPVPGRRSLVQRQCACGGGHKAADEECAECKKARTLQRQLTIGASDDPLEHEADRVADQILSSSVPGRATPAVPRIQRAAGGGTSASVPAPKSVEGVLASSGHALPSVLGQDMADRFGYDFSHVRVHTGAAAEQSAREINANAYTAGHHIAFAAGRFSPATADGRRLIAHELTHVVQQGGWSDARSRSDATANRGPGVVQRQSPEVGSRWNDAVSQSRWTTAVRVLMEMNEADAGAAVRALNSEARESLRAAIVKVDPSRDNRLARLIEASEHRQSLNRGSSSAPPSSSVPRPTPLALQQGFALYQVTDMDPVTAARIPSGRVVTVGVPPSAKGIRPTDATSPTAGTSMSIVTNINRSLMQSGFAGAPGGNGIGLVGIPRLGTPGAVLPEGFSAWGHTAVYARVNGQIVISRGFTTGSLIESALKQPGILAGTEQVPGVIANDLRLFTYTGARAIEFPVSGKTAFAFVEKLPMTGAPPAEGPRLYTGRPSPGGAATNCVGWACAIIESELGGKVGTVGPEGQVLPITEPGYPGQGLQGRFMQASAEGVEIAGLPRSTGAALTSGMPRYFQLLKWGGRVFIVVGAVMVVVETAQAPEEQRARTLAGAGGGFAGGLLLGATAGLMCGPGALACSIVLGLAFGLAGSLGGRALGEAAYDTASGK